MKGIAAVAILFLLAGCAGLSENQRVCNEFLPDVRSNFGAEYGTNMLQASEFHCIYTREPSGDYIGVNYLVLPESARDSPDAGANNYSVWADGTEHFIEADYEYYYKGQENGQWLWLSTSNNNVEIMVVFPDLDDASGLYYPKEKLLALALAVSEKVG